MITDTPDPDIRSEQFFQDSIDESRPQEVSVDQRLASIEIKLGQLMQSVDSVGILVQDTVSSVNQATEAFTGGGMPKFLRGIIGNG